MILDLCELDQTICKIASRSYYINDDWIILVVRLVRNNPTIFPVRGFLDAGYLIQDMLGNKKAKDMFKLQILAFENKDHLSVWDVNILVSYYRYIKQDNRILNLILMGCSGYYYFCKLREVCEFGNINHYDYIGKHIDLIPLIETRLEVAYYLLTNGGPMLSEKARANIFKCFKQASDAHLSSSIPIYSLSSYIYKLLRSQKYLSSRERKFLRDILVKLSCPRLQYEYCRHVDPDDMEMADVIRRSSVTYWRAYCRWVTPLQKQKKGE